MNARFVVRLLTADDRLLAWADVTAEARPKEGRASCAFVIPCGVTPFAIEAAGTVAKFAVHWPDLDIARVREIDAFDVEPGQVVKFAWLEPVWLVSGMRDVALPAVTARGSVTVYPPAGGLTAVDPSSII